MRKCGRPAGAVEHSAEHVVAGGTVGGVAHVIFACPLHLHRSVDGFRYQRGFDGVIVLKATTETAT